MLIDFWAEWCPPCKKLKPNLEKLASNHAESFDFVAINVDNF